MENPTVKTPQPKTKVTVDLKMVAMVVSVAVGLFALGSSFDNVFPSQREVDRNKTEIVLSKKEREEIKERMNTIQSDQRILKYEVGNIKSDVEKVLKILEGAR